MKKYRISDILAQEQVIRAVKHYGIEGAEQKIKGVYSCHPKIIETMLRAWHTIYFRKEK